MSKIFPKGTLYVSKPDISIGPANAFPFSLLTQSQHLPLINATASLLSLPSLAQIISFTHVRAYSCSQTSLLISEKMGQNRSKLVVQGEVAPGYETIKDMFQQNFE